MTSQGNFLSEAVLKAVNFESLVVDRMIGHGRREKGCREPLLRKR